MFFTVRRPTGEGLLQYHKLSSGRSYSLFDSIHIVFDGLVRYHGQLPSDYQVNKRANVFDLNDRLRETQSHLDWISVDDVR